MSDFLRRHGVLIALVALAAVFYMIGYRKGSVFALAIGMVLEISFWVKFARRNQSAERKEGAKHRA
jgi:hypothetical protein